MSQSLPPVPYRKSKRVKGYDYTSPGSYAITICAHNGRAIFGKVTDGEMILNPLGKLANKCCQDFGKRHKRIRLDAFVIMPNHIHILFTILERHPNAIIVLKERAFGDSIAGSVSAYIGGYKGSVTQHAKNRGLISGPPLWQSLFWDRIVRDDLEFENQRNYIDTNPARWLKDQLHPDALPNKFNEEWHKS